MILLDTDHCSVLFDERDKRHNILVGRLEECLQPIVLPVVAANEVLRGIMAMIHKEPDLSKKLWPYSRLSKILNALSKVGIADFDLSALTVALEFRSRKLGIGTNDLCIAAIAVATNSLLLTRNTRDFRLLTELHTENWLE